MTLEEYIDTIIEVAEELKNESIDYDKMAVLHNLLNKLVDKYKNKLEEATPLELDGACWKLSTEKALIKSEETKTVVDALYTATMDKIKGNSLPASEENDEEVVLVTAKMGLI